MSWCAAPSAAVTGVRNANSSIVHLPHINRYHWIRTNITVQGGRVRYSSSNRSPSPHFSSNLSIQGQERFITSFAANWWLADLTRCRFSTPLPDSWLGRLILCECCWSVKLEIQLKISGLKKKIMVSNRSPSPTFSQLYHPKLVTILTFLIRTGYGEASF